MLVTKLYIECDGAICRGKSIINIKTQINGSMLKEILETNNWITVNGYTFCQKCKKILDENFNKKTKEG